MDQSQPPSRIAFVELAHCLSERNQRFLDFLKESGDDADLRSKILARIIDTVADGLIVLDEKLTIVLANLAAAKLASWQIEDMTRDELRKRYHFFSDEGITPLPFDQEPIVIATRERRACEMTAYVISEHLPAPGRWVRVHAAPLFDDQEQLLGGVSVFTDITENLKLQRQRNCLAALITHDIKNHLAAEQMFLEDLHSSATMTKEDAKLTGDLKAASKRFMQIADSLLDTFRSDWFGGKETTRVVDMTDVVKKAFELSSLEAANHRVRIELDCPGGNTKISAQPDVICHVVHNLIQNAIEASPSDGAVNVRVSAGSNIVTVKVSDNGAGMTPQEVASLFTPPGAEGKVTRSTHSSGFGLYLSHLLIEGQGGQLSCQSQHGVGTSLTIKMPTYSLGVLSDRAAQ